LKNGVIWKHALPEGQKQEQADPSAPLLRLHIQETTYYAGDDEQGKLHIKPAEDKLQRSEHSAIDPTRFSRDDQTLRKSNKRATLWYITLLLS
jgi:hypothetical protein